MFEVVDTKRRRIKLYDFDDEWLPARWEICGRCNGDGGVDRWDGGMTMREIDEYYGPDAGEFIEDYLDGKYSKPCPECGGDGKVMVPDEYRMTDEQKERVYRAQEVAAEQRAYDMSERRFASGYGLGL